jgi:phosphoribosylanthranilate isomerase
LGMILEIARSPRSLSLEEAEHLAPACEGKHVLVVESMHPTRMQEAVERLQPAAVQLHGSVESRQIHWLRDGFPQVALWKTCGIPPRSADPASLVSELLEQSYRYAEAGVQALLVDTRVAGTTGGSGRTGDWKLARELRDESPLPLILAGGLRPDNILEATLAVQPSGLDVSSGVEEFPGRKSSHLLKRLFRVLRDAGLSAQEDWQHEEQ